LATPTSPPKFEQTYRFSTPIVGAASTPGWTRAVELTHTFRTEDGGVSKLVLLDCGSFNLWNKQVDPTGSADLLAVIAEWTNPANCWAGRDTTRPAAFVQLTKTLNEKLRRAYRMT
jgi:hypothetical protein